VSEPEDVQRQEERERGGDQRDQHDRHERDIPEEGDVARPQAVQQHRGEVEPVGRRDHPFGLVVHLAKAGPPEVGVQVGTGAEMAGRGRVGGRLRHGDRSVLGGAGHHRSSLHRHVDRRSGGMAGVGRRHGNRPWLDPTGSSTVLRAALTPGAARRWPYRLAPVGLSQARAFPERIPPTRPRFQLPADRDRVNAGRLTPHGWTRSGAQRTDMRQVSYTQDRTIPRPGPTQGVETAGVPGWPATTW